MGNKITILLVVTSLFLASVVLLRYASFPDVLSQANSQNPITGGIIPHHEPALFMADDLLARTKSQEIKHIILLAPNHLEQGGFKVISSRLYQTPVNTPMLTSLQTLGYFGLDQDTVAQEYAVSVLIPYLKKYHPEATITPLLFSRSTNLSEIDQISPLISDHLGNESLVIASIDFAHYVSPENANQNDKITLKLIEARDYPQIISLDSQHLDSPPALVLLLKLMGSRDLEVLNNSNYSDLTGSFAPTTSYFEIVFR